MEDEHAYPPSRSARKRAAQATEDLARGILDLSAGALTELPLDRKVRSEIELARRVRSHGARKRQIKHLASLLRSHDEDRRLLQQAFEQETTVRRRGVCDFHRLEVLRENICDPQTRDAALEDAATELPGLDRREAARLAAAWREQGDRGAYRALFRCLRDAQERRGGA